MTNELQRRWKFLNESFVKIASNLFEDLSVDPDANYQLLQHVMTDSHTLPLAEVRYIAIGLIYLVLISSKNSFRLLLETTSVRASRDRFL